MKIIPDQGTLEAYLPNVLRAADGERVLYDKVRTHLLLAEQWVAQTFTSDATLSRIASYSDSNALLHAAATAIASEALRRALPALDLVLTPNGFGIVSNANIAPASKERVERLAQTLTANRDAALGEMLCLLPEAHAWPSSGQAAWFRATLFPDFSHLAEPCWERYVEERPALFAIEQQLAHDFFSLPLLDAMRQGDFPEVASLVRPIVLMMLRGAPLPLRACTDVVNVLRADAERYALWAQSEVGQRFLSPPPAFANRKDAHAYWF